VHSVVRIHRLSAPALCTGSLHRLSAPALCTGSLHRLFPPEGRVSDPEGDPRLRMNLTLANKLEVAAAAPGGARGTAGSASRRGAEGAQPPLRLHRVDY